MGAIYTFIFLYVQVQEVFEATAVKHANRLRCMIAVPHASRAVDLPVDDADQSSCANPASACTEFTRPTELAHQRVCMPWCGRSRAGSRRFVPDARGPSGCFAAQTASK